MDGAAVDDAVAGPSPVKAPRAGPAGVEALRFMETVLIGEELDDSWHEPLRASGYLDGKRLLNHAGLRGGAQGLGGLAFHEAAKRLAAKMRSVQCVLPSEDLNVFKHELCCILRAVAASEKKLTDLMTGEDPAAGTVSPQTLASQPKAHESTSDREMRLVGDLERCVAEQLKGRPPPSSLQACYGDIAAFAESFSRDPSHLVPLSGCSLESRSGSSIGGALDHRHRKGKEFKHKRGKSRSEEQRLLRLYLRAAATGGAMVADFHTVVDDDYLGGLEEDGNPVALIATYTPMMTHIETACQEMDRADLTGDQSMRYVDDFIEALDTALNAKRCTLTEATRYALELHLSRSLVSRGTAKRKSRADSDSSDDSSDSGGSDSSDRPARRRKPAAKARGSSAARSTGGTSKQLAELIKLVSKNGTGRCAYRYTIQTRSITDPKQPGLLRPSPPATGRVATARRALRPRAGARAPPRAGVLICAAAGATRSSAVARGATMEASASSATISRARRSARQRTTSCDPRVSHAHTATPISTSASRTPTQKWRSRAIGAPACSLGLSFCSRHV